jgi:antitoxin component YwqK of YwqJK toxin-antitoxin module
VIMRNIVKWMALTAALMLGGSAPGLPDSSRAMEKQETIHSQAVRVIEQDSDQDGRVDRIAHVDEEDNLVLLEIDSTGDGRMDTRQYYRNGQLDRIVSHTLAPSPMTVTDYFENGNRRRHQKQDQAGRIRESIDFDENEEPLLWERDTSGDGRVDTVYQYENNRPVKSLHDTAGNGAMNTVRHYRDGELTEELRDTSGNGAFDVRLTFREGMAVSREEDTDHDGIMDRFTEFDKTGTPVRQVLYEPGRKEPVRIILFDNQGRIRKVEADTGGDGRMDSFQYFKNGVMVNVEQDRNGDGIIDSWHYYEEGQMVRVEQDRSFNGNIDARMEYKEGNQTRAWLDTTGDGRFDTVQRFDDPAWSMTVEMYNGDGNILRERRAYKDDVMRLKEVFDPETGRPTLIEAYDEKGRITQTREAARDGGPLDMIWHFDDNEVGVAAEKDTTGDGRIDTWYYYVNGRIDRVAEDRNGDGRPDLWETYDASGAIISRSEDINLDGTPDIEKTYETESP